MSNQIAEAIVEAARLLGNGDAATSMGAIEAFGMVHKEGMSEIAEAINRLAEAIEMTNK